MPIRLTCACGKTLSARDELAGMRVRCSACRAVLQVPEFSNEDLRIDVPPDTLAETNTHLEDRLPVSHGGRAGAGSAEGGAKPNSIRVTCACGRNLAARPELAGKNVRCPGCRAVLRVPLSEIDALLPDVPSDPLNETGTRLENVLPPLMRPAPVPRPSPTSAPSPRPIPVECACGRKFNARPELAGKNVRCPACRDVLTIPWPSLEALLPDVPADPLAETHTHIEDKLPPRAAPGGPTTPAAGGAPSPIRVACACGRSLAVRPELAGKNVRCPACRAVVRVPAPASGDDFVELPPDAPADPLTETGSRLSPVGGPVPADSSASAASPCPVCAVPIPEGSSACPGCGLPRAVASAGTTKGVFSGGKRILPSVREGNFYIDGLWSLLHPIWCLPSFIMASLLVLFVGFGVTIFIMILIQVSNSWGGTLTGCGLLLAVYLYIGSYVISYLYNVAQAGMNRDPVPELPGFSDRGPWPGLQMLGLLVVGYGPLIPVSLAMGLGGMVHLDVVSRGTVLAAGGILSVAFFALQVVCDMIFDLGFLGVASSGSLFVLSPTGIVRSLGRNFGPCLYAWLVYTASQVLAFLVAIVLSGMVISTFSQSPYIAMIVLALIWMSLLPFPMITRARVWGLLVYHFGDRVHLIRGAEDRPVSIDAVAIGVLVSFLISLAVLIVASIVYGIWLAGQGTAIMEFESRLTTSTGMLIFDCITSLCIYASCGFLAAVIAGRAEVKHGLWVGIVSTVIGLLIVIAYHASLPVWYIVVSLITIVPCSVAGGYARKMMKERGAHHES